MSTAITAAKSAWDRARASGVGIAAAKKRYQTLVLLETIATTATRLPVVDYPEDPEECFQFCLDETAALLHRYEAAIGSPYIGPSGATIVAIGHNLTANPWTPGQRARLRLDQGRDLETEPLTDQEMIVILRNDDLPRYTRGVRVLYGPSVIRRIAFPAFFVLVRMAFQMGVGGLGGFPSMNRAIRKTPMPDYARFSAEMIDSKWARDEPVRAAEEIVRVRRSA